MKLKTIGIIGGIGPESTIDYYKKLIYSYRKIITDGSYPHIIVNSIDMNRMLELINKKEYRTLIDEITHEIANLKAARADFAVMASNTPHVVFNEINNKSSLPLISIVDSCIKYIEKLGIKKVTLWGTKTTMNGGFYKTAANKYGIDVIIPNKQQQDFIHDKYFGELVQGIFKEETLKGYIEIANQIELSNNIEGIILGGTELPLLIKQDNFSSITLFDTTSLHVDSIIKHATKYD